MISGLFTKFDKKSGERQFSDKDKQAWLLIISSGSKVQVARYLKDVADVLEPLGHCWDQAWQFSPWIYVSFKEKIISKLNFLIVVEQDRQAIPEL